MAEALLMAGHVRLRPILITTLATIFGFLPLAIAFGEGSEMLQPLGRLHDRRHESVHAAVAAGDSGIVLSGEREESEMRSLARRLINR